VFGERLEEGGIVGGDDIDSGNRDTGRRSVLEERWMTSPHLPLLVPSYMNNGQGKLD
jgi:hypothetical protein